MEQIHYDGLVAKNMILPCLNIKQCGTLKKKARRWYEVKRMRTETQNPISV
jgi:hypothetical protein